MSKLISKKNYTTVAYGSEGYKDLSGFTELNAEVSKKGEIRITISGNSKRVGLSKDLLNALGNPASIKVFLNDSQAAFKAVPEDTPGAYVFGKGAIIYNPELADMIMHLAADTEFKDNTTTRCGHIDTVQSNEDGSITVFLSFD